MTEIWLVRHGETDWNRDGLYQGQADIPLNENGLRQARETASKLAQAGVSFAALYSSPLQRALQTARETAARLHLSVQLDERLKEIDQGDWTGRNYKEVVSQFDQTPSSLAPQEADGLTALQKAKLEAALQRAPGGESVTEVAERMAACASEIAARHPGARVLVFSHGLALATLYCRVKSIPLEEVYQHIPHNGGALVIDWPAG